MHAGGVFTGGKKALEVGEPVAVDANATHLKMRGGEDLNFLAGEVESDLEAAVPHPREVFLDEPGAEVRDIDPDAAVFGAAPGAHFEVTAP